jgi:hypothetical protein
MELVLPWFTNVAAWVSSRWISCAWFSSTVPLMD